MMELTELMVSFTTYYPIFTAAKQIKNKNVDNIFY